MEHIENPIKEKVHPIGKLIQVAIEEKPSRISHGYTTENAFWITPEGKFYPHNKFSEILQRKKLINVHSHLPENWKQFPGKVWDTFSPDDIYVLKWMLKNKVGNKIIVLTSDNTMDTLEATFQTDPKFLKMGIKTLRNILNPTKAKKGGYLDDSRIKLHKFANKYGLKYKETIYWKEDKKEHVEM